MLGATLQWCAAIRFQVGAVSVSARYPVGFFPSGQDSRSNQQKENVLLTEITISSKGFSFVRREQCCRVDYRDTILSTEYPMRSQASRDLIFHVGKVVAGHPKPSVIYRRVTETYRDQEERLVPR